MLVKQYEKPESTLGGIIIPEASRLDNSWTTWEIVSWGERVEEAAGLALAPGDIIRTLPEPGVDARYLDADDLRPMWFVHWDRVMKVIKWR